MPLITRPAPAETAPRSPNLANPPTSVVLACIDRSRHCHGVLAHAAALARAMNGRLVLIQVLDPHSGNDLPPDPIDWEVRRREATTELAGLARHARVDADIVLAQGRPADEICQQAERCGAEFIVLGRLGEDIDTIARRSGMGATARSVIECAPGKVLLVPACSHRDKACRRILVPLDGSCWPECALPTAIRLSQATGAEIVLAQVVTQPEFLGAAPPDPDDMELQKRFAARNQRAAQDYLQRKRDLLALQGAQVDVRMLPGADARNVLLNLMNDSTFDLVVLSARGSGYRHRPGHHVGSVASHLGLYSGTPLLIVQPDTHSTPRCDDPRSAKGTRSRTATSA